MSAPRRAVALAGILLAGCTSERQPEERPPTHEVQGRVTTRYAFAGRVVATDPSRHVLVIAHDAIPGYMGAMTMPYPVGDAVDLARIRPGDRLTAELVVRSDSAWLERVVVHSDESNGP